VDLYGFVSWSLVIVAAVTLIWPVNIPLVALAYRVHQGRQPSLMETRELWLRSTLGALGLCGLSLVMIGLIYVGVEIAQVTAGPVQLTLFVAYLAAAVGFLFWVLALEDMVKALGVFSLYILLPGLPLLLLGRILGFWQSLQHAAPWLLLSS